MKSRTLTCITAMTLFTVLAFPLPLVAQEQKKVPPRYSVIDLGTLGGTFSQAFGINNNGTVVGFATLSDAALPPLHALPLAQGSDDRPQHTCTDRRTAIQCRILDQQQ
jgi:hypothetical protein